MFLDQPLIKNKEVHLFMKKSNLRFLLVSAMVAAIYFIFTVVPAPLSYGGIIQFRFAEIMVLLVFIDKRYIPGLVLGCFLANLLSPFGIMDAVLGTLGSLFSVVMIALTVRFGVGFVNNLNEKRTRIIAALYVSSLWPVLSSVIIAFGLMLAGNPAAYWSLVGSIAFGQFVVISVVGVPLFIYILSKPSIVKILRISDKV